MSRHFASTTAVVCFCFVLGILSFAQAPPSADSYVTTAMPAANFGGSPILPVQPGTTSYVQLNLGAFPANASITKATLRLYVDAVTAPGSFDVYAVTSNWSERGLTAGNAPALGASATGGQAIAISKASVNQFVLVDITALVQGWMDGSIANHGVALALTSSTGSFAFDSKESSGHHPELEIMLGESAPLAVTPAGGGTTGKTASSALTALGIQPNTGSSPYINNGATVQTGASFNIDGTGTAATLNAVSGYQLNGAPLISQNGYLSQQLGLYAGASNTGNLNTFAGVFAGAGNTSGAFNTVVGAQANYANSTGNYNSIFGAWAGVNNTGTNNAFYGAYAGYLNTSGVNNMFFGTNAGHSNTTGNNNFFLGAGSGYNNTTGINNTFLGYLSGQNADATASNNLYIGSLGAAGESGTTRIGDASSQTAAYIAGVSGAATSSGVPVFIDSTGKLGTTGGSLSLSFSQVTGTLGASQISSGTPYTFSNAANVFNGTLAGNGAAVTNVNAATLNGVAANGFILNSTTQQSGASFNISGSGAANGFNSATTYQIGGGAVVNIGSATDGNLFLGLGAGANNTTGKGRYNVFVGTFAGQSNTTASGNLFAGFQAGSSNTTGGANTFIGDGAGYSNQTACCNVFTGNGAGYTNTLGSGNAFTGGNAGYSNTTGMNNVFAGSNAGFSNTTGGYNTTLGMSAGQHLVAGSNNIDIGYNAGPGSDESNTIRVGVAGTQTATYIAGIGGASTNSGVPVFIDSTGKLGTAGGSLGQLVMSFNGRTGAVVPASGDYTFSLLGGTLTSAQLTGTYSNALTLSNTSNTLYGNGSHLTGVLPAAGSANYIQNGTGLQTANFNITGDGVAGGVLQASFVNSLTGYGYNYQTIVTAQSLYDDNLFLGVGSGVSNQAGLGQSNVFVGSQAGFNNTYGDGNVFIGPDAGYNIVSGQENIDIGDSAGPNGDESNTIRIGTNQTATYIAGIYKQTSSGGVAVYVNSNGQLGTVTSSRRFKEQINDMGDATSRLFQLRPVTFVYKPEFDDGSHQLQYGLIAEEVAKVFPELVVYDKDGQPYTVKYQFLAPMLLNEVQKQQQRAEAAEKVMVQQQQQIADMQTRLERLEALVGSGVAGSK